jgi:hypothetical protein
VEAVQVELLHPQKDCEPLVEVRRKAYVASAAADAHAKVLAYRDGSRILVDLGGRRRVELPPDYAGLVDRGDLLPVHPRAEQFPIIQANALTIHKAQGSSLDECVVDLRNTFAPGHVYVGMSRLRTAAGLTITTPDFRVQVDPDVMRFYMNITRQREQNKANATTTDNQVSHA